MLRVREVLRRLQLSKLSQHPGAGGREAGGGGERARAQSERVSTKVAGDDRDGGGCCGGREAQPGLQLPEEQLSEEVL